MFRNQQHPTERTLEFRRRMKSRRPRTPHLALNVAHVYVGVSRQAVSARIRSDKLPLVDLGYARGSRWNKVRVADLDAWIARREAHLPARTKPEHRPQKSR